MLDKTIKSVIDTARNILVGKVPNPVSQIDLITIAMIYKFMDDMDNSVIKQGGEASFFKNNYNDKLTEKENAKAGNVNLEPYAWHKLLSPSLGNDARINLYSEALDMLQRSKQIPELFRQIFKGAFLPFRDGGTLTMFLKEIDKLSYDNSENLGNGFEYLLSIMGSQGDAGQFRTPRHIIDFIVDVVNPSKEDTILDPACGTAGFLISAFKHILKHNSEEFDEDKEIKSYSSEEIEIEPNFNGDKLTPAERIKLTKNIKGYDISQDMQKLALVNLYLHGFKKPYISEYDTLSDETTWKETFDVILANPPFMTPKGGIKPHKKFSIQANRSEVLFVDYILEHININGKAGIIVPEGIIFQSATAYKKLRKKLIDENFLYAVVSLPSGVFQPYSGVKTSILFIDKEIAKRSDSILFLDIKNDGFDLGAQRKSIQNNDLPHAFSSLKDFKDNVDKDYKILKEYLSRHKLVNLVKKSQISKIDDYNLSASRYIAEKSYSNCNWDMVKLGNESYFQIESGGTPSSSEESYWNGQINWATLADLPANNFITFISETNRKITDAGLKNSSAKILPKNSVLISSRATIGRIAINKVELATNQGFKNIIIKDFNKVNVYFLAYMISAIIPKMLTLATGGTFKEISKSSISTLEIPLPPIEIQENIVKELDSYQAVIDGARKVVENWKPNITIKSSWKKVQLVDICEHLFAGGDVPKNAWEKNISDKYSVPIYTNGIAKKALYGFTNIEKVSKDAVTISARGTIGHVEVRKAPFYPAIRLIVAIPKSDKININYLKFILQQIDINGNGNSIPQLTVPMVKEKTLFLPSLKEQEEIVTRILEEEYAVEQSKKLIEIHQQKISDKIKSIWGEVC